MLKKIISHAIVFFIICIVALSQVFVDKSFIPYSLNDMVKLSFWQRVSSTVEENTHLFAGCVGQPSVETKKNLIGMTNKNDWVEVRQTDETTWDIVIRNADAYERIIASTQYDIPHDVSRLSRSLNPIIDTVIYPSCTSKSCMLHAYSLSTGKIANISVISNDSDTHDDSFSDLELLFYDEERHLIIYQSRELHKSYVVEYSETELRSGSVRPYLWHDISIETNDGTTQKIIGVQEDLHGQFYLLALVNDAKTSEQKIVLYNLSTPALKMVRVPNGQKVKEDWIFNKADNACVPVVFDDGTESYLSFE